MLNFLFLRFKYSFTLEVQVTLYTALTQYSTLGKMEKQEIQDRRKNTGETKRGIKSTEQWRRGRNKFMLSVSAVAAQDCFLSGAGCFPVLSAALHMKHALLRVALWVQRSSSVYLKSFIWGCCYALSAFFTSGRNLTQQCNCYDKLLVPNLTPK